MNKMTTYASRQRWVTVLSIVVLAVVCLVGPAAVMASPDGQCGGPECQAAFHCPDGAASLMMSAPTPARIDLPVVQLPAVHDLTPPEGVPMMSESATLALATRRFGPLAPRSPPSLL